MPIDMSMTSWYDFFSDPYITQIHITSGGQVYQGK